MGNWLLPESLADVLPAEARRIEELRRELLDLYRTYGFELVAPPWSNTSIHCCRAPAAI